MKSYIVLIPIDWPAEIRARLPETDAEGRSYRSFKEWTLYPDRAAYGPYQAGSLSDLRSILIEQTTVPIDMLDKLEFFVVESVFPTTNES